MYIIILVDFIVNAFIYIGETYILEPVKHKHEDAAKDTPPTSKLVSKLFPKLKNQQEKQQHEDQSKIQAASKANVGDGIQSKALRDKLIELEREIEKFRNENSHLAKLRTQREEVTIEFDHDKYFIIIFIFLCMH